MTASTRRSAYDAQWHGPKRVVGPGFHDEVYEFVCRVPPGAVTTYGDIAAELGLRSVARHVGFALAGLSEERADVPWHRVVNARGLVSARTGGRPDAAQVERLRSEGVEVSDSGRVLGFAARRHDFAPPR